MLQSLCKLTPGLLEKHYGHFPIQQTRQTVDYYRLGSSCFTEKYVPLLR